MTKSESNRPELNRAESNRPALVGLRVLELGELVSAPYATKLLADLGADVIKVEQPDGDRARHRGPYPTDRESDPNVSGLFLALNTNKRSVVVDPDGSDAVSVVAELVADADIVVTNLRQNRLAKLGFHPALARKDRPELVVCSITPFGLTGPYADYHAEELTTAHGGGWAYQCPGASSDVDDPPLKVFGHQTNFHAGIAGATASLAAYDRVQQGGVGDHIDFSTMAHTVGMLEAALIATSYMGAEPSRLGSRLLNPWKIFPCKSSVPDDATSDGSSNEDLIFLVTVEQDQWERLVKLMGNPEWTELGLFDTVELRLENEDLLIMYLKEWMSQNTVADLWHRGQAERVCFAPVLTMAGMEEQEHLKEREFFVAVDHPEAGTVTHLGQPFLASPTMRAEIGPAPLLDEKATPSFWPGRPSIAVADTEWRQGARPLEGVRVLDLSWVWAGPYCGLHLAHLGAEVIKIESEQRPGLGRRLPIHPAGQEPTLNTSAYFNQWEQGKLSCKLDLSKPEAIELVKQLAATCDVVIENFATGVMEKLGLGYEELAALKPDIIVASISGYGSTGPLKSFMGYGPTTGPLSGLTSLTGYLDGPPRELGISVGDPAAGITTAFAICAAVVAKRSTGTGCYIDTALWESTACNAVEGWMAHALTGQQPARTGNRDDRMAPHGCYRTGDLHAGLDATQTEALGPDPGQWLSIACATDEQWGSLATLMDGALSMGLADDARFATAADRKANEDELDELMNGWVAGQDRWDLTRTLQAVGVAAFPSMSTKELLADQHLEARGFFARLDHPEVGRQTHAGVPWLSTESENGVTRPAPMLGQHTDQVLTGLLGLTEREVAELEAQGIIA